MTLTASSSAAISHQSGLPSVLLRSSLLFLPLVLSTGCGAGAFAAPIAQPGATIPQANSTAGSPGGNPAGNPGGSTAGSPGGSTAGNPGGSTAGSPGGSTAGSPGGNPAGGGQLANRTINIRAGGTYSGDWVSLDPNVAAVTISTDEPVTIQNSTVTGRGHLIAVTGKVAANLSVKNVTGWALDPQVSGRARGAFVVAYIMNSLVVQNCTMSGVSFGIKSAFSNLAKLSILNNVATDLEDRASDGNGGFLTLRPQKGHFVLMHQDVAPGGEIAWNKVVQTIGTTSTEDVFNMYLSTGAAGAPINIHDNYMEGYSSLPTTSVYTGNGIITDGDKTGATGFVRIANNLMLHMAGGGVSIANGHDVTAVGNRVVSCGMDAAGRWYTDPHVSAIYLGNYYGAPNFSNNSITGTTGGLVAPDAQRQPVARNVAPLPVSGTNSLGNNSFTDPCLLSAKINLDAEDAERALWNSKAAIFGQSLGDQHTQGTGSR